MRFCLFRDFLSGIFRHCLIDVLSFLDTNNDNLLTLLYSGLMASIFAVGLI